MENEGRINQWRWRGNYWEMQICNLALYAAKDANGWYVNVVLCDDDGVSELCDVARQEGIATPIEARLVATRLARDYISELARANDVQVARALREFNHEALKSMRRGKR